MARQHRVADAESAEYADRLCAGLLRGGRHGFAEFGRGDGDGRQRQADLGGGLPAVAGRRPPDAAHPRDRLHADSPADAGAYGHSGAAPYLRAYGDTGAHGNARSRGAAYAGGDSVQSQRLQL